ncbi:hypothetical protein HBI56_013320 [Parastagonospora nodorum]|nr:hypothetical protein HBH56_008300 [Parastagonospora nodorum]KAH3922146.1 hypothetical protein HBH54_227510 [Parastagonospora nodorum]KAH3939343.1 hypothetical protein HBH53_236910 [Parastagonospora nodorum]KAH3986988.1 hypothetical protein HBH51_015010 [Parastagonospora nodorum]KAH4000849.1 hypothetical protein HBI10_092040 [Parastagonospora nodorum]
MLACFLSTADSCSKFTKAQDECRYLVNGEARIVKCSTKQFANYRCTKDNNDYN